MNVSGLMVILRRRWWLVAAVVVATLAPVVLTSSGGPDTYLATGTYVVRPSAADENDLARATSTLSDADEIKATFAAIARSNLIRAQALDQIELDEQDASSIKVIASDIARTNIIEISARSHEPDLSRDMAVAVGDRTSAFVSGLSDVYILTRLDTPTVPSEATGSRVILKIAAATIVGLGLGVGVAWISDRLCSPRHRSERHPLREFDNDTNDERFSRLKLLEETSRSDHSGIAFRVAVLRVAFPWRTGRTDSDELAVPRDADLTRIERTLAATLREHDHLGHFASIAPGTFAALLPDLTDDETDQLVTSWRELTTKRMVRSFGEGVVVTASACRYHDGGFEGDPEAEQIANAL